VPRENFLVDARLVVHALEVRGGDELDEVFVARLVFGQEQEMGRGFLRAVRLFFEAAAGREVDFAADDGLHARLGAFLVKFDGAEEVAVVGEGKRGHLEFRGARGQFGNAAGAVEEAVLGVDVKMDEGFHSRGEDAEINHPCLRLMRDGQPRW
jgi:hypothetical protein